MRLPILLVLLAAIAIPTKAESATPASVARLVSTLTAVWLPWEEREKAETQLEALPAEPVLLALIPQIGKGMPPGGIWNGTGSAKGDSLGPAQWQVFYGVHRVWDHHARAPSEAVGKALIDTLPTARSKQLILTELGASGRSFSYWVDEAEPVVVKLLHEDNPALQNAAAHCLLGNTGDKHYAEIKAVIRAMTEKPWQSLLGKAQLTQDVMEVRFPGHQTANGAALFAGTPI